MKKIIFCVIMIFVFNVFGVSLYSGNIDLTKLQEREKERRKDLLKPKFSLNDENLDEIISKIESRGNFCQIKIDPLPIYKYDEPIVSYEKTREYWQNLKNELGTRIKNLKAEIKNQKSRLNKLHFDYLHISFLNKKLELAQQMKEVKLAMNLNKLKLAKLQQEFDYLPEKARKSNIPPGWIR